MECTGCNKGTVKNGKSKTGIQRYYCQGCRKYRQERYRYTACERGISQKIVGLKKESCGVRGTARILKISSTTVIKRVKGLAKKITRPFPITMGREYEVDEMRTYIGSKKRLYWIVYAIDKETKAVVDFKVGKRTMKTLQKVVETLVLSGAKKIFTDGYSLYRSLIPEAIHRKSKYSINGIERKNLSIRTHLKRLSRKTICFSKSKEMFGGMHENILLE